MVRARADLLDLFGIRLIGVTGESALRVLMTLAAIGVIVGLRLLILGLARAIGGSRQDRRVFWVRQGTALAAFAVIVLITISIWFDSAARLTTVAGFATAGLAIAAQRAVTAFSGYLIIMRGRTFTVGDRIKMGGVQGDVIALGFLQTRILEMGQPPEVNEQEAPGMWVRARQYSGRVVTVTNDKIFDEPVYNFTRELPFIWEEITVPVAYRDDSARAARILLEAATEAAGVFVAESDASRRAFEHRYGVHLDDGEPRVYWRLTDNWIALTVRFLVAEHGIRKVKDAIARRVLAEFRAAGIHVASTTIELSGEPVIRLARARREE